MALRTGHGARESGLDVSIPMNIDEGSAAMETMSADQAEWATQVDFRSALRADHMDRRDTLAGIFRMLRANVVVERVYFGVGHRRTSAAASMTRIPRLFVPLAGRHQFMIDSGAGSATVLPGPGEAVFLLPGSWWFAIFDEMQVCVSIAFETGGISILARNCVPALLPQRQVSYQTQESIVPEGLDLIHALNVIGRSGRNLSIAPQLVCALIDIAESQLTSRETRPADAGQGLWNGICAFVRERFQQPLDRNTVAAAFEIHPNHLSRLFGLYGRQGFNQFLVRTRLEEATRLLRDTYLPIAEVALRSGFRDDNYFRFSFRRHFGVPPSRFRRQYMRLRAVV